MKNVFCLLVALILVNESLAQISFEDKTDEYGFTYRGRSFGSSWGDINNDGWYDIFMSCHYHTSEPFFTNDFPKLFLNNAGQSLSFEEYSFDTNGMADLHGAVFFDYDNDGDQDLLVTSGGLYRNVFYENNGQSSFTDSAVEEGLDLYQGRGRQATCFDFNNDGLTDLLFNHEQPNQNQLESQIKVKNFGSGYDLGNQFGWQEDHSESTQITDLDGDGFIDLLITQNTAIKILSRGDQEDFTEVFSMPLANVRDVECADFNNDLLPDIFIARGSVGSTSIERFNDNAIHSTHKLSVSGSQSAYTFETTGAISIKIYPISNFLYTVHLGSNYISGEYNFNDIDPIILNADAPVAQGWQEPDPELQGVHVYIGEISENTWRVEVVSNGVNGRISTDLVANDSIQNMTTEGVPQLEGNIANILLLNQGDFNFVESDQPDLQLLHNANSVTVGDYDNDGDIDLYSVVSAASVNSPNISYENDGNGNFTAEENGWNTFGQVPGIGESATSGDINNDGRLDLFLANGASRHFLDSAKHVLYINQTANDNNWVMFKLIGDSSNNDGFGAKVFLTANGSTQLREMSGGVHGICQDDPRLHFGLGNAQNVESVQIQWPSGVVDEYSDLESNQIYTLYEGDSPLNTDQLDILEIALYPNPSIDGMLNISLNNSEPIEINIYDMSGRLVFSDAIRQGVFSEDLSYFNAGVYIVEIETLFENQIVSHILRWIKN